MRLPLTLRLAYHGLRSAFRAALLFFCAWIVFVPASADENTALGASAYEKYPVGLRAMRSAKAIVAVAPDRFYTTVAEVMGPEVSPLFVRIAMIQVASGGIRTDDRSFSRSSPNTRNIDGPKFIQVD